jgi:hypothetical protein
MIEKYDWQPAADFFDTGIQKLIPPYKRLNSGGDYVEQQFKYYLLSRVYRGTRER